MTEAEQNQTPAQTDAEATLVSPRFDATEAQTAQPVVPLAAVRGRQRSWPLLLLSAFLGGAVSVAGLYLYQRHQARAAIEPRPQVLTPAPAETAQVAAPPTAARAQAEDVATTSDAVRTPAPPVEQPQAEKRAALIKEERAQDKEKAASANKAASTTAAEERARPAEPTAARRVASAPRGERVANERQARASERPHAAPARPMPQPARNVDRIRDIFEGVRPPH